MRTASRTCWKYTFLTSARSSARISSARAGDWGTSSMLKSLRWRLQLWYALVLLAVVGGFAGLLYAQMRVSRLGDIDHDLDASAHYFDAALRRFPPSEFGRASGHERPSHAPPEMFPDDFDRPFPP